MPTKQPASLTFQISEKLGGHVGVISAPSVASLAAAEKGGHAAPLLAPKVWKGHILS